MTQCTFSASLSSRRNILAGEPARSPVWNCVGSRSRGWPMRIVFARLSLTLIGDNRPGMTKVARGPTHASHLTDTATSSARGRRALRASTPESDNLRHTGSISRTYTHSLEHLRIGHFFLLLAAHYAHGAQEKEEDGPRARPIKREREREGGGRSAPGFPRWRTRGNRRRKLTAAKSLSAVGPPRDVKRARVSLFIHEEAAHAPRASGGRRRGWPRQLLLILRVCTRWGQLRTRDRTKADTRAEIFGRQHQSERARYRVRASEAESSVGERSAPASTIVAL